MFNKSIHFMEEMKMKKWNTPEVAELNIEETACGIFCSEKECWPWINDNKADKSPETPEDTEKDPENFAS